MRVKLTIIPFILALIACVGLKVISIFGLDSNGLFMGLNKMDITYTVIGISIALLVVCIIINLFDRRTAPVYPVKKNIAAGVLAILTGAAVVASSIFNVINTLPSEENYIVVLICGALSVPAGIAFVAMSKVHFSGESTVSGISMLFIFPAIWACAELVSEFLAATKVSISVTDMSALFCFIFIALYMFSYSMIVSRIKGRNPVKACFIYGYPAIAISLAYGICEILTISVEGFDISRLLNGVMFSVMALFAASFILEMNFNLISKDAVEVLDGIPSDTKKSGKEDYVDSDSYDKLPQAEKQPDKLIFDKTPSATDGVGYDGFIMGYDSDDEHEPIPYLTKSEMKKASSSKLVFLNDDEENKTENKSEPNVEQEAVQADMPAKEIDVKEETSAEDKTAKDSLYNKTIDIINDIPKADEHQETPAKEKPKKKSMSDIDMLLQELENKK